MKSKNLRTASTLIAGALIVATAGATEPTTPPPVVEAPPVPPLQAVPTPVDHPDRGIANALTLLSGSFRSRERTDGLPAMRWNAAPIKVEGLSNAVYFEVAREDDPSRPFRSGVMTFWRRPGPTEKELILRVCDIGGSPSFREAIAGLWAHPESLPTLKVTDLIPTVDMVGRETPQTLGYNFNVDPDRRFPTFRDGAVTFQSMLLVTERALSTADRGYDADGNTVWAPPSNTGPSFERVPSPAKVDARPDGLVVITIIPPAPDAPTLVDGGELTAHYTGWLSTGTQFDSSRQEGREPLRLRLPGGVIQGWNEGLKGIAKGERRRLVIPPALGYGERGAGRGVIPPNATLIFDVEAVHIDNTLPTPPTPPPVDPTQPTGQPAGQPAGGGTPETPKP
jgi:hypothetical protein